MNGASVYCLRTEQLTSRAVYTLDLDTTRNWMFALTGVGLGRYEECVDGAE